MRLERKILVLIILIVVTVLSIRLFEAFLGIARATIYILPPATFVSDKGRGLREIMENQLRPLSSLLRENSGCSSS